LTSSFAERRPASLVAGVRAVINKDLLLEWRSRARVNATIFFAFLTLLLFLFAVGPDTHIMAQSAAGYLWLAVLLSSVLSLGESFRMEAENAALEGLRLLPVDPKAMFLGKAIANTLFLFLLAVILVPVTVAMCGVEVQGSLMHGVAILFLGAAAISAPGTLYAAIASQVRARDVLLPLLLFPVLIPAIIGAVKATKLLFAGDPMGDLGRWTALLIFFNATYWLLCLLLFGRVVEE